MIAQPRTVFDLHLCDLCKGTRITRWGTECQRCEHTGFWPPVSIAPDWKPDPEKANAAHDLGPDYFMMNGKKYS